MHELLNAARSVRRRNVPTVGSAALFVFGVGG
jgi:hypothetical protein